VLRDRRQRSARVALSAGAARRTQAPLDGFGEARTGSDFNQARASITSQPQAMMYVDTAAILTALYDIAIPIAQIRERNAPFDINSLPSANC